jgi:hypothetical protein
MMTPCERADAIERCGVWGPESDLEPLDPFPEFQAMWRLLDTFPGYSLEQIMAGLRTPACEETKP